MAILRLRQSRRSVEPTSARARHRSVNGVDAAAGAPPTSARGRRRRSQAPFALGLLVLVGCSTNRFPVASEADAARMATRFPGATAVDLNRGRELLLRSCGTCHQTPMPHQRIAAEWPPVVAEMAEGAELKPLEAQQIERYLMAFAKDQNSAQLGAAPP